MRIQQIIETIKVTTDLAWCFDNQFDDSFLVKIFLLVKKKCLHVLFDCAKIYTRVVDLVNLKWGCL